MSDPRDYKLDISGLGGGGEEPTSEGRPFLRVTFACCNVYTRLYRSASGDHYTGHCPKCGRGPIRFKVDPNGGTSAREFVVY
jgi:hypothetical protein